VRFEAILGGLLLGLGLWDDLAFGTGFEGIEF